MGLTTWKNAPQGKILKSDVSVAKSTSPPDRLRTGRPRGFAVIIDLATERGVALLKECRAALIAAAGTGRNRRRGSRGMTRIAIQPKMLRWARERAGLEIASLSRRTKAPGLGARGRQPTIGNSRPSPERPTRPSDSCSFPSPPEERLPIPDLRTLGRRPRPSPELLDTIYAMQRRQDWLREERVEAEAGPLEFVGSARLNDAPAVGQEMRRAVGVADGWAGRCRTGRKRSVSCAVASKVSGS